MYSDNIITLCRNKGVDWEFKHEKPFFWISRQKKYKYRLFISNEFPEVKPIWIGRFIEGVGYITIEKEIGAMTLYFPSGQYYNFNTSATSRRLWR